MPTLGQELKQCREEKKITLDEISNATHISVRFLQAIERDDYKELPGDLYNRSFVRALARAVGFDELRALQSYERQSGAARVPTDEESVAAPADALKGEVGGNGLLLGLVAALIVLIAAGVWYVLKRPSGPPSRTQSPPPAAAVVTGEPASRSESPAPSSSVTPDPTPSPSVPATGGAPDGITVDIVASGQCWMRMQADEGKREETVLTAGATRTVQAKEKVILSLGAAVAVAVKINGRPAKLPSKDGLTVKGAVISLETIPALLGERALAGEDGARIRP